MYGERMFPYRHGFYRRIHSIVGSVDAQSLPNMSNHPNMQRGNFVDGFKISLRNII